ncbi:hypothetical protein EV191_1011244 [Tamaricihabitans halophyticus]|uniref:Uncharacterized protein n=1 Tax=Tamaricihabitans halophyticus TaxID=1262583 RepID=A0A4R2R3A9_9PSEU|nr:hypothetical protein [Tamaricihabitans halophyticus]TCP57290.1 hypothetical protein EV191_1011244 [Tamaricihabitans halophyticus]
MNQRQATASVRGREVGAQIAGVFGLVFVAINSTALAGALRATLLVIAGLALAAILALSFRSYRQPRTDGAERSASGSPFGWKYWLIVAIEAVALFGGSRLISEMGYPELGIAWVAFIVGTHFFALAVIFRLARFHLLGAIVTVLGLAGFAIRALGHVEPIALVSGVLSGFTLLAFGLWAFAPSASVHR